MSETQIFSLPESTTTGNGLLGVIAPLLQQRGLDPNMVYAMMSKNNNGGMGADGGWFWWVIFLFFLMGWGGNGWGGMGGNNANGIPNQINNDYGRQLLLDAINRNGTDLSALASTLNCSTAQVQNAINQVQSLIQGVSNQVGMSSQQVINAMQNCCCDIRSEIAAFKGSTDLQICQQTNTLGNAIANLGTTVERGFASTNYETFKQTCDIQNAIESSTNRILEGQRAAEMREMQNKIDSLRERNQTLEFAASQASQNSYLLSQLQPVAKPSYIVQSPYQSQMFPFYGINPYNAYNNGNNYGCSCGCGV